MFSLLLKRRHLGRSLIYLPDIHSTSPGSTDESKIVRNRIRHTRKADSIDLFDQARQIFFRAKEERH